MGEKEIKKKIAEITAAYNMERKALEGKYMRELSSFCVPHAKKIARFKVGDIIECEGIKLRIGRIGAKIVAGEVKAVYAGLAEDGKGVEIIDNGQEIKR